MHACGLNLHCQYVRFRDKDMTETRILSCWFLRIYGMIFVDKI